MRLSRWIAVSMFPVVAFVSAAGFGRPSDDAAGDHVRRHLDSVLVELRANQVERSNDVRQARRARLLDELGAYRNRGAFPHNYDFPGQLVPYFRDRETGALCAVGALLAFTGRSDIVDRVASQDNNVRVAALAGDTAFRRWLDDNGLTLAEAARIQVAYVYTPTTPQFVGTAAVLVASPLAAVASFGTSIANLQSMDAGPGAGFTKFGIVSGSISLATGIALMHSPDIRGSWGRASTALGALSLTTATWSSVHRRNALSDAKRNASGAAVALVPTVDFSRGNDEPRLGGALSIRF